MKVALIEVARSYLSETSKTVSARSKSQFVLFQSNLASQLSSTPYDVLKSNKDNCAVAPDFLRMVRYVLLRAKYYFCSLRGG